MTEHTTRSGRPAVGDTIELQTFGVCVVESNEDPSIVILRAPSGARLKIGDRALRLMRLMAAGEDARPTA